MRLKLSDVQVKVLFSTLIAGSTVLAVGTADSRQDILSDHLLQTIRGADGKTYNDGSPTGCESINVTGDQVTSSGCNASNTFPFTAATCVTCGNPNTQNQATKSTGTGNGVNQTTADCGKKRVGTCQNNEQWPAVTTSAFAPSNAVLYTCNDSGSLGQGNCSSATQTSQQ